MQPQDSNNQLTDVGQVRQDIHNYERDGTLSSPMGQTLLKLMEAYDRLANEYTNLEARCLDLNDLRRNLSNGMKDVGDIIEDMMKKAEGLVTDDPYDAGTKVVGYEVSAPHIQKLAALLTELGYPVTIHYSETPLRHIDKGDTGGVEEAKAPQQPQQEEDDGA